MDGGSGGMTAAQLREIIAGGEGTRVEFKIELKKPELAGKPICAFANTSGGILLIGVDDQRNIVGAPEAACGIAEDIARSIDPPVKINAYHLSGVVCIEVPLPARRQLHTYRGKAYLRRGARSFAMNSEEMEDYLHEHGRLRFDEMPCHRFSLQRDLDPDKWELFMRRARLEQEEGQRAAEVLQSRDLLDAEGRMTNAGALVLAKDSRRFNAGWETQCTLYDADEITILSQQTFHTDIATNIDEIYAWIMSKINVGIRYTGGAAHEKVPEVPRAALREIVTNALAHRDYRDGGHAQVSVFRDRIQVYNPGSLPDGMTADALLHSRTSMPRNKLLFRTLKDMGFGERAGRGIHAIRALCRKQGLPAPEFMSEGNAFIVTIHRQAWHVAEPELVRDGWHVAEPRPKHEGRHVAEPKPMRLQGGRPQREQGTLTEQVVRHLAQRGPLPSSRLAPLIGRSATSVTFRNLLRGLMELDRIEYSVPDKPRSRNQQYRLTTSERRRQGLQ